MALRLVAVFSMLTVAFTDTGNWLLSEVEYLASLGSRRTGSCAHNRLIDRIQGQLELLGLQVNSDVWTFDYENVSSLNPGGLFINGQELRVSSTAPYSGHTPGVTAQLVAISGSTSETDWSRAKDAIAVVNITNAPVDLNIITPIWPGSPQWNQGPITAVPSVSVNPVVARLAGAHEAGVKAAIYVWDGITDDLATGLYAPFNTGWLGTPAIFVSGSSADVVRATLAVNGTATVSLPGELVPNTPTRNIWTVIPGTTHPNESVLLTTHTDGTNIVEENGHIPLLAYAKFLTDHPPQRTTVLGFITGHIHSAAFTDTKRSTSRWMADHPELWNGTFGMKAVFASCAEHLGAVAYEEDVAAGTYKSTGRPEDEILYASTPELVDLLRREWRGADPGLVRVIDPNQGPVEQFGEGLPFFWAGIPEVSLITSPSWLLNEFSHLDNFDERQLIDLEALQRQVDSFVRVWRAADAVEVAR
ncbi:hypothetical protein MCOR25_010227 [Pyricularia grisea]|nr:hypothetical protein MCOR25_010227 [Pyricularia grisea]